MDTLRQGAPSRRLRGLVVVGPAVIVASVVIVREALFDRWFSDPVGSIIGGAITIAIITFLAATLWRRVEIAEARREELLHVARDRAAELAALHESALALTGDLDLDMVLRRVVQRAADLTKSRYGAVAVVSADGTIDQFVTIGIDDATRERLGAPPTGHGLLGLVIQDNTPVRVEDISAHPRSVGFPAGHPPMRRLLAVPLSAHGSVVGSLYLSDRSDGLPFSPEDQAALERFATVASIAVGNARLHREVRRLSLLDERERIGMDLHDGVMQALYATALGLEGAAQDIDADPTEARHGIERAIDRIHGAIGDIRHYVYNLRGAQGDGHVGLEASLRQLLDGMPHPGVDLALDVAPVRGEIPRRLQWECWHVAREAVTNALRHGGCRRVWVTVAAQDGALEMRVRDDGAGFDPTARGEEGHFGLRNMARRAAAAGGRLTLDSAPGRGTTVALVAPLQAEPPAQAG